MQLVQSLMIRLQYSLQFTKQYSNCLSIFKQISMHNRTHLLSSANSCCILNETNRDITIIDIDNNLRVIVIKILESFSSYFGYSNVFCSISGIICEYNGMRKI